MRRLARFTVPLLLVGCAVVTPAHGYTITGNDMLPACKTALRVADNGNRFADRKEALAFGLCMGTIHTLVQVRGFLGFCPSAGVTNGQFLRVAVAAMERHSHRLHEDFVALTAAALVMAYPCGEG